MSTSTKTMQAAAKEQEVNEMLEQDATEGKEIVASPSVSGVLFPITGQITFGGLTG